MKNRAHFLLNIVFITGLLLLAFNDHFLKETYGNWMTGKLSDFAGVLILPLFLKYLTGWRNGFVIALTVIFFTWFKSPLSTGVLDAINSFGFVHLARVVDYTDLLSFAVLPLSWWTLRNPERFGFGELTVPGRALVRYGMLPLCLFLFVATSEADFPGFDGSVANCCAQEPTERLIGNGYLYVPSAFTPDLDGINDVFQIVSDSNIVMIDSFRVFTASDLTLVFSADSITDFSSATGWDGTTFDGTIASGSFEYTLSVTAADGTRSFVFGVVCSLPCPTAEGTQEAAFVSTCTFGNQLDSLGRFDRTVNPAEDLSCY